MGSREFTMVLKLALLVVGLVSTSAFASPFPDADTVVPEAEDLAQTDPKVQSVPLLRRARSNEDHKRLVDWISHTHTRKEHPQILIDEGATISSGTKLVTETALKNADLVEYYGQVQVGGQSFAVVFDTGSGIFWVPGERCKEEACQKHEQLKLSKLINVEDGDVDIKYGTGHMSGQRAVGSVHVGGVKVKNQDFLMSTQEHGEVFSNGRFDGVFGFGRKQLASILKRPGDGKDRAAPFYINAIHQNLLQKPEFSLTTLFTTTRRTKLGLHQLTTSMKMMDTSRASWLPTDDAQVTAMDKYRFETAASHGQAAS